MESETPKNGPPITVAVVEDSSDYRIGISFVLKNSPRVECVGEFISAEDLIENFEEIRPDIVLMDIGLPGIS